MGGTTKQKPWMWKRRGGDRLREYGIAVIRIYLIYGYCQRLNSIHLIFKNLGMVLHVYDPSYSRHWSGRILSWGQPELHRNTPSLKKEGDKRKIHWDYSRMNTLYLTRLWACPSNSWNIVGFHLHISIGFYSLIIGNSTMFPQNRYDCHKGDLSKFTSGSKMEIQNCQLFLWNPFPFENFQVNNVKCYIILLFEHRTS